PAIKVSEIPPGRSVKERFQVRFPTPGPHRIAVRLEADAVAADKHRYAVVDFPSAVPVLLIDGDPKAVDAKYVSAVFAVGGQVTTGLSPRIESPRFLASNPLEPFRAVYLLNVDHLEKSAIAALERYLAAGGGVAFFVGERTRADFVNQALYREGQGPFPVPLAHPAELLPDYLQKAPDLEVAKHPIFEFFSGQRNTFLPMVIVSKYYGTAPDWKPESDPAVQVIARLRNGAPLAAEKRFGQGRVVAFLTTAAPVWNNWARDNPSFPVVLLELQAFLASQEKSDAMRLVGSPLELRLDSSQYDPQIRFDTPEADSAPLGTVDAVAGPDGRLVASLAETDTSGFYQARLARKDGQEETRCFAVNVEAAEGDLRTLRGEDLFARLDGIEFEYHQAGSFQYNRQEQAGYHLADTLWYLLLGLLLAEQLLAWSASYHPPRRRGGLVPGGVR
ncbi:MAG: hypothetical protein NUV77_21060, partial [Thermoguttaceae bacterium]|nr:hypothetical protein [Thermoguttaceae bacterium]